MYILLTINTFIRNEFEKLNKMERKVTFVHFTIIPYIPGSMSASCTKDTSIKKCGRHQQTHLATSVSQSTGVGYRKYNNIIHIV